MIKVKARFSQLALDQTSKSSIQVGQLVVGTDANRRAVISNCPGELSFAALRCATVAISFDVPRIDLDAAIII